MNNLQISDDYKPVLEHVKSFIKEKIEPVEEEFHSEVGKGGDRWQYTERMTEILEDLKNKAKKEGLWNFQVIIYLSWGLRVEKVAMATYRFFLTY